MALEEYKRKRDFKKTAEPPPGKISPRDKGLAYLIQKHDATRLHYDFRLELDGVLLSWAVTKGPSINPSDKRLAVRTEDHPLAYGSFEGTIPKGEYGGGTVMLWDQGTWVPKGDPRQGLKKGRLAFELKGQRLKGGWNMIRMRGDGKRENWLLIKETDDQADANSQDALLERESSSITTGRSMEEIADGAIAAKKKKDKSSLRAIPARPVNGEVVKSEATKTSSRVDSSKMNSPSKSGTLVAAGVTITHPERVISREGHVTKGELAEYHAAVAPFMLPHLARHPISLLRCPSGIDGKECFYQRNLGRGLGKDVHPFEFRHDGKHYEYLYLEDEKGLLEIIQMGAIEIHPWGASIDAIDYPDRLIFDLDPASDVPFEALKLAAKDLRQRLKRKGLESGVKCTGGKGLHVIVPLAEKDPWPVVKAFAASVAAEMVSAAPAADVATMSKVKRTGKIFIDYFRNDYTATAIADYSVRARPGVSVAVPLLWDELPNLKSASSFSMKDVLKRLARHKLPTEPKPQTLPTPQLRNGPGVRLSRASARRIQDPGMPVRGPETTNGRARSSLGIRRPARQFGRTKSIATTITITTA